MKKICFNIAVFLAGILLIFGLAVCSNPSGDDGGGATPDAGYPDKIRFVKADGTGDGTSWDAASGDLQAMIDAVAASSGSIAEVWVAAGTYKPAALPGTVAEGTETTARDNAFRLRAGVKVYGGFAGSETGKGQRTGANKSVLSGDFNGDDTGTALTLMENRDENAYHVLVCVDVPGDGATVLDGFTIKGGRAGGSGNLALTNEETTNLSRTSGGGILNVSSSPVIQNVTITGNYASNGGGMYNGASCRPVLTNVMISDNIGNSYGGGMYNYGAGAAPVLYNVTVSENYCGGTGGGGICSRSTSASDTPAWTNVTITGNVASYAGGLYLRGNANPVLTGGTISGNTSNNTGGGVTIHSSSPSFTNVTISNNTSKNTGGGGIYIDSNPTSPILTNITVTGNIASAAGGGIYIVSGSTPTFDNVTMTNNIAKTSGGGIYNAAAGSVFTNVTVAGNTVTNTTSNSNGGGVYNTAAAVFTNVTVTGNRATNSAGTSNGGGMYNTAAPFLTNVTIAGNYTGTDGGGMYNTGALAIPEIRNSIIWGNTTAGSNAGVSDNSSAASAYDYSLVEGVDGTDADGTGLDGTDDDNNPLFVSLVQAASATPTTEGDYRLQEGSPAIDAGNNDFYDQGETPDLSAIVTDRAGNARIKTTVDMGAYEYWGGDGG
jgi:parallel beta-helix repeat protein